MHHCDFSDTYQLHLEAVNFQHTFHLHLEALLPILLPSGSATVLLKGESAAAPHHSVLTCLAFTLFAICVDTLSAQLT